ncbi:MAG: hypothetical protein KC931_06185, partial [Candidatus Omnitrophica bacterium]|nr:hypothetical protein [Candidatus Omnitrophota bacterium]
YPPRYDWQVTERHLRALCRLNSLEDKREKQAEIARKMIEEGLKVSKVETAVEKVLTADENGDNEPRESSAIEVHGMPPSTSAKVSPGKLVLEIRFEDAESWSARWEAVADIFGTIGFDPNSLLNQWEVDAIPSSIDPANQESATTEKGSAQKRY